MRNLDSALDGAASVPGILSGFGPRHTLRAAPVGRRAPRFVTQSYVLDAPRVNPRAVLIAATIAVALLLVGWRVRG